MLSISMSGPPAFNRTTSPTLKSQFIVMYSSGRYQTSFNAFLALPVAARAISPLALRYVVGCTSLIIVVTNAFFDRLLGLFNRAVLGDFGHWYFPPRAEYYDACSLI